VSALSVSAGMMKGGYDRGSGNGGVYSRDGEHDTLDEMIRLFVQTMFVASDMGR
jgi:hypothetical protein